ncbi:MAG: polyphosphate kinase 1 [Chloroflexi bacterium]|nr:polyphosphate kinase 1 [Chloroflexota bacterium]
MTERQSARSLEHFGHRSFINKELSRLDFYWRVLREAQKSDQPLLERFKFLAISDSNLDEFLMVRMSGLLGEVQAGIDTKDADGRTPEEELDIVRPAVQELMEAQQKVLAQLVTELAEQDVRIESYDELSRAHRHELRDYFEREIFPVCTPLAIDPAQAFPFISNLSLNLLVVVRDPDRVRHLARVKVPPFPRLISVPGRSAKRQRFVWLEDLLQDRLDMLFPDLKIEQVHPFRVLRDADFEVREIEAGDLLERVRAGLQQRRFGQAVALQVHESMPEELRRLLAEHLELDQADVYEVDSRLGLTALWELHDLNRPELKDDAFVPHLPGPLAAAQHNIFAAIQQGDILLHHPFDSFDPIIELLSQAARDPNVLAIKQTLYRVGLNSPIVEALRTAVDEGKQVAVLLELKARFDEENNIGWAEELERAGVHVMYGFAGLKTHCKVALIVRREDGGIRRYVHMGSGNYNRSTARQYTDVGILTCREEIGADASDLFNFLTGYSRQTRYRALLVAPHKLRSGVEERIEREITRHHESGKGHLMFKMNALEDPRMIRKLYEANQAGVRVDLLVRGICCLRPGVKGLSENIRVVSLVGRFLEHSRIYYFRNGGEEEVLIGSADMMRRNLDYRVEALLPVLDAGIRHRLKNMLDGYLADTVQSWELQPDGKYAPLAGKEPSHDMQAWLLDGLQQHEDPYQRLFVPAPAPTSAPPTGSDAYKNLTLPKLEG